MGEDLRKLKAFLAKYNVTRKVYQEMANRIEAMEIKIFAEKSFFLNSFGITFNLVLYIIPLGVVAAFLFLVAVSYVLSGVHSALLGMIVLLMGLFIAVYIPYRYVKHEIKKKMRKTAELKAEKEKLSKEYTAKLAKVYNATNKAVAFRYASPFIVDQFIDYMECGRCDTLKECINLYEQERTQFEQTTLLKKIHKNSATTAAATDYLAYHTFMESISR